MANASQGHCQGGARDMTPAEDLLEKVAETGAPELKIVILAPGAALAEAASRAFPPRRRAKSNSTIPKPWP